MINFQNISFDQMSVHFGEIVAYGHLEQIERAAGISPRQMVGIDPETRLTNAIRAQDTLSEPTLKMAA